MNKYKLIEFTSEKKITHIYSPKNKLSEVLSDFYKNKINSMFDIDGTSKGFISIFINSKQLFSIQGINLNNDDEIQIVTSISGG